MFKKSRVSLRGRWIITAIFALCIFIPVALLLVLVAPRSTRPPTIIGFSLLSLIWAVPLYYFAMLGRAWARYITILFFSFSVIANWISLSRQTPLSAIIFTCLIATSTAILICSNEVKAGHRRRTFSPDSISDGGGNPKRRPCGAWRSLFPFGSVLWSHSLSS